MQNFSAGISLNSMFLLCFCFFVNFSLFSPLRAEIIYQHNFENLGYPPLASQLNSPEIINPNLTPSLHAGFNQSFILDYYPGNKGLANNAAAPRFYLEFDLATCKKVEITSISFKVRADQSTRLRIVIDNKTYTGWMTVGSSYMTINQAVTASSMAPVIQIQLVNDSGSYSAAVIDDLTIQGSVTESGYATALENFVFFVPASASEHCQGIESVTYPARLMPSDFYREIRYTLDEPSTAAGVSIDNLTGEVAYPRKFTGQTVVSATLSGCQNESTTKTFPVLVKPGGIPVSDMDLQVIFRSNGKGDLKSGCYSAGWISAKSFAKKEVPVEVRFKNGVRSYDVKSRYVDYDNNFNIQLYFSQSDFDNYKGALPLPKNPTDEQGKRNLRLIVVSDYMNYQTPRSIMPSYEWDNDQEIWKLTISFNSWDARFSTRITLGDSDTPLPVKLKSISATSTPEGNRITWKTTEEINFSHFEIESSVDPRQGFKYLATVQSNNIQQGGTYQFFDAQTGTAARYYRLKMVDFDNTFEYSKIVVVNDKPDQQHLIVYPNPAQNSIFVSSGEIVKSVMLINPNGKEMMRQTFQDEQKVQQISLPKLPSGEYLLKVNPDMQDQKSQKIVIE